MKCLLGSPKDCTVQYALLECLFRYSQDKLLWISQTLAKRNTFKYGQYFPTVALEQEVHFFKKKKTNPKTLKYSKKIVFLKEKMK